MGDEGYARPERGLSDGWATIGAEGWGAPLYWHEVDGTWMAMSLSGMPQLNDQAPVCHVSFYEADAFARWAGTRLPGEAEWDTVAASRPPKGNFLGPGSMRPAPAPAVLNDAPEPMFAIGHPSC